MAALKGITTTLVSALEVATGLAHASHYQRRRRREFPGFMNRLVAQYSDRALHVVLDNRSTQKPKPTGGWPDTPTFISTTHLTRPRSGSASSAARSCADSMRPQSKLIHVDAC